MSTIDFTIYQQPQSNVVRGQYMDQYLICLLTYYGDINELNLSWLVATVILLDDAGYVIDTANCLEHYSTSATDPSEMGGDQGGSGSGSSQPHYFYFHFNHLKLNPENNGNYHLEVHLKDLSQNPVAYLATIVSDRIEVS